MEKGSDYASDSPPTIVSLEIKPHFEALNDQEKRYAHYISRAAFSGTRVTLRQVSAESEDIFDFIIELYKASEGDLQKIQGVSGISTEQFGAFLNYAAQFLGNGGNYKGFGNSKFEPNVAPDIIKKLSEISPRAKELYAKIGHAFFASSKKSENHLGYIDQGHVSTYYPDSPSITKAEIQAVGDFLESKGLLVENTRLQKLSNGDFQVLIASAVLQQPKEGNDTGIETSWELSGPLSGKKLSLKFGDYQKEMEKVVENLYNAARNALNDAQRHMQREYIKSFETGSMKSFKDSQRFWIHDKGPTVETNIGFIETYRDPHGVRGEWEGFVAMVNKPRTQAFQQLVESSGTFIAKLPWPRDFEKEKFFSPDFTSLEVLSFQGSGIPAGINIPNFDDIRQSEGFKNVSLGNVLSAKVPDEKTAFVRPEDQEIFWKYRAEAFEVQVGIHELLGHGTGKLLQETSPGVYNFDHSHPPENPLTKKPISSWYLPSQTWGSVFGSIAASYEECRAEAVAMALCCEPAILSMFKHTGQEALDVLFVAYLTMARAGLAALEFWDPVSRKWGQAHMRARFSILQCFLDAGEDFVTLSVPHSAASADGLTVTVDRNKIPTVGRKAVEQYLLKLHVYKSIADVKAGTALYEQMTHVDEFFAGPVRAEVIRRKVPRRVFVQANTVIDADGKVSLKEYEPTPAGMIKSWAERGV